ncbi:unnamed protein product [Oreochromis niloticus]|nr:unnamed protein product [Mustela putorius furo]
MNIIHIFLQLGLAAFVLQVDSLQGLLKTVVSVWPPGSKVYLGESVLLKCTVESNSTAEWSFEWDKPKTVLTLNPRHLVSNDSYFITAVTREDAGSYRCKAGQTSSQPVELNVSELTPPSLILTPSMRYIFSGERFSMRCPSSQMNAKGWKLRHYSPDCTRRRKAVQGDQCSPLECAVVTNRTDACVFNATIENSGLYWCEGPEGRSNSVRILASYDNIIMKTPAVPVFEGDNVILYCQYKTTGYNDTTFFKNGAVVSVMPSSPNSEINMTIENVTKKDEGSYKCASLALKMESTESWLSVRPKSDTRGYWKWIILSVGLVFLFLIPLSVWLFYRHRYQMLGTWKRWPFSKEDVPAVPVPATKQDVTEVQWDLSWMEMSNLLDKQIYPGT